MHACIFIVKDVKEEPRVPSPHPDQERSTSTPSSDSGSSNFPGHVEEGWYVTPPPCFTGSQAVPVELETTPLENMLIEHPSMSVYGSIHSLRSQPWHQLEAQEVEDAEGEENTPPQRGKKLERAKLLCCTCYTFVCIWKALQT